MRLRRVFEVEGACGGVCGGKEEDWGVGVLELAVSHTEGTRCRLSCSFSL